MGRKIVIAGGLVALVCSGASAATPGRGGLEFDAALVAGRALPDLSRFAYGNPVVPGVYRVEVYANNRWLGRHDVRIDVAADGGAVVPCFDRALLSRLSLDPERLSDAAKALLGGLVTPPEKCLPISAVMDGVRAVFDGGEQRVDVQLPQAALLRRARGFVGADRWDPGVNMAALGYRYEVFDYRTAGLRGTQQYLGLNARANFGLWQLRHDGVHVRDSAVDAYRPLNTYLRRDLTESRLAAIFGDSYTDGQLFDSFALRGLKLATDERMLPESQRGYAPVIRGTAFGNAKVEVHQRGALIYEVAVPPGPFQIDDLYPTGLGGDLEVRVTEADGTVRSFTVPFSATPMLLREGGLRFSLAGGVMRDAASPRPISSGTVQYGLNNRWTLNAGAMLADGYMATVGGAALNSPVGAWSLDWTYASAQRTGIEKKGSSLRLGWSKVLDETRTNLSLAAYRYASEDYLDLKAADSWLSASNSAATAIRERSRLVLGVAQSFGRWGSLNLTHLHRSYWGHDVVDSSTQLNYGFQVGPAVVSIGYTHEKSTHYARGDERGSLSVNIPFGRASASPAAVNMFLQRSKLTGESHHVTVNGTGGEQGQYGYLLGRAQNDAEVSHLVSVGARTGLAAFAASSTQAQGYSSSNASISGGIVAHSGGLTFAPELGETMAIVQVDQPEGVKLEGFAGTEFDHRGYAVLPYLSPYMLNSVELDLVHAPADLELDSVSQMVAPHSGAVVSMHFKSRPGRSVLIKGRLANGRPLPFGAAVFDMTGQVVGSVGQAGRLDVRLLNDSGQLRVQWGPARSAGCVLTYKLPASVKGAVSLLSEVCGPQPDSLADSRPLGDAPRPGHNF